MLWIGKIMNKSKIFRKIYENEQKRDKYLMSIPADIRMSVVDNAYTNSVQEERDMLLRLIFEEYTFAIEWFLYEWTPGAEVGFDTDMVKINSIDEYIDYMKNNEGFED